MIGLNDYLNNLIQIIYQNLMILEQKIILDAQLILKKYQTVNQILKGNHKADQLYIIAYNDKLKFCFRNKSITLITQITLLQKCFQKFTYNNQHSNYKNDIEPSYICEVRLVDFNTFMGIYKDQTLNLMIKDSTIINSFEVNNYSNMNAIKTIYIDETIEREEFISQNKLIFQVEVDHLEILEIIDKTFKKFPKISVIEFFYDSQKQKFEIFLIDAPLPMKFSLNVVSHKNILEETQRFSANEWKYVFYYATQFKKSKITIKFYEQSAIIQIKDQAILIASQIAKKVKESN